MVALIRREGVVDLLAEVLRDVPNLRGASCVGHARLFDADRHAAELGYRDEDARWRAVAETCRTCPVRGRCWEWSRSVPQSRRPHGPVATALANPFTTAHRRAEQEERDEQQRQNDAATTMARAS